MDLTNFKNKKVMVVDDFANVRRSIKAQLIDLGLVNVFEAYDGESASKILKETKVDLILCDYNLGKGRDGARLLEEWRIRKMMQQSTIFVLITAETARDVVVSAMEFEPDDYLAKPFTMEVLANRLQRWFERRQVLLPLLVSLEKHDWAAVADASRQIIEEHPRYRSVAQKNYVEALFQLKQFTQAEHFLHGLLDKRFVSWAQTALHRIDLLQNKYESAETGFKEVLRKDPNLVEAYDYLAHSLQALDKEEEMQEWLEQAVQRAPKNIDRQRKLIRVAQRNLDYRRASQGLRDVLNMSTGTMHEHVGIFQEYIKNLQVEEQNTDNDQRKREITKEIASVNRRMNERYSADPNSRLFSKALTIRNSKDKLAAKTHEAVNDLLAQTFEHVDEVIEDTAFFICETLYEAERESDADELVNKFKKKYQDYPDIVRRFDELQAEPVSMESRKQAKALNLKGIELYKNKNYEQAIPYFRSAMELSPRHPGIILNFVQSHMLRMKTDGIDKDEVNLCLEYMGRLKYLPEDHSQYERFVKLNTNLKKIQ